MKKTIKLAVVAALALGATSAFATNGDHLIGLGAKARGMGGVNVGISHGSESGLANPAMITTVKDSEVSGALTAFMPKVSAGIAAAGTSATTTDSAADFSVIPEISYATRLSDDLVLGFGMWGTAGMGVDYAGTGMNMEMVTELQLMQIGLPIAYKAGAFSVGITPVLQYGSLEINYDMTAMGGGPITPAAETDIAFGYNIGLAYSDAGVTVGLVYKSAIEMTYDGVLSTATTPFVPYFGGAMADTLEQPSELGLGASYNMGEHTVAFDYKQIAWSDAAGYGEFGWDDQTVMALGYEYTTKGWALRLGYNKADNPISDVGAVTLAQFGAAGGTDMTMFRGNAVNMFNLLGFPATVESHITLGGTYDIDDAMSLDVAYVIAPKTTTTLATMPMDTDANMMPDTDIETTVEHSQSSLTVQVNYAF